MNAIHPGTVRGGKFAPDNVPRFREAFYPHEGKTVEVVVRRKRKARSNQQNRYYHGVVLRLISDTTGYSPTEAHEAMKMLFLLAHRDGLPDTVRSTADLSTAEMEEYLSQVRQWASVEISTYIPDPNEIDY